MKLCCWLRDHLKAELFSSISLPNYFVLIFYFVNLRKAKFQRSRQFSIDLLRQSNPRHMKPVNAIKNYSIFKLAIFFFLLNIPFFITYFYAVCNSLANKSSPLFVDA